VTIDKYGFHPSSLEIVSGQYVAWTNADTTDHTATANDGSWDTGPIAPGKTISLMFFELRKWDYICGFVPALQGSLTVKSPPPNALLIGAPARDSGS
jgi:plastocyanin